jgi:heme exporter protein A
MLEAIELDCTRGRRALFRGLSFLLRGGELLRVAGANGSGKTSLLRILCGLLSPTAGEVRWQGTPIARLREEFSRQLVYLGHAPAVKGELSAAENLSISCTLAGLAVSEAAVREALARFGLPVSDVPLRRLSQGQTRRAALARLFLSGQIPCWFLDEPFAALDADAVGVAEELIGQHVARGGGVIYTTHQDTGIGGARVIALGTAA